MKKLSLLLLAMSSTLASAANVEVSWTHPTAFTDGTPLALTQIASTKIEYGTCSGTAFGVKAGERVVPAPAATVSLTGFTPGLHCFRAATTTTTAAGGLTSTFSGVATKTIDWSPPNPPTIVTVATVARIYKASGELGKVAGTIPLGKACGELLLDKKKADWYTVNREDVQLNSVGRKSTAILVAKCA
jgi:hypothetical protein